MNKLDQWLVGKRVQFASYVTEQLHKVIAEVGLTCADLAVVCAAMAGSCTASSNLDVEELAGVLRDSYKETREHLSVQNGLRNEVREALLAAALAGRISEEEHDRLVREFEPN